MTNIKQLAQHLDISVGTISRALNGKPGVNPKTREKVLAGALKFGYVPNQSGRSLRKGVTQTVGIVIEIGRALRVGGDNFFMAVIDSAQEVINTAGFNLVILPCRSADEPAVFLQQLIARGTVDGIIMTATRKHDPRIELLLNAHMPFVTLGRSDVPGNYSWIDLDFENYARNAVRELVKLGHRRIALTGPDTDANLGYVLHEAYKVALHENGLAYDPDIVFRVEQSEYGGTDAASRLLAIKDRPTAVILSYEQMAIGFYSKLLENGLKPGVDLSIIGFRNNPQLRFLQPNLSCHALDLEALGRELGEEMLRVIRGSREPSRTIWPGRFEPTDSIGPPR